MVRKLRTPGFLDFVEYKTAQDFIESLSREPIRLASA